MWAWFAFACHQLRKELPVVPQSLAASILEALRHPALIVGRDERVLFANAEATELFGAGIAGRHHAMALRTPAVLSAIAQCLATRDRAEARHAVPLGSRDQVFRVNVAYVEGSEVDGALCIMQDITETEEASQMRRDFVANVSHELKTPLTALMGFIETLRGPARNDPAAQERFLAIMDREAGRMNRLVRDLLQLSRVEAEERIRPSDPVDLASLILMTIATLRPMSRTAGVEVRLDVPAEKFIIPGDADQLTQVFHNLLENGIKYGASQSVVQVTLASAAGTAGPMVRVDVVDQGEGIPAIHLPRLTERFYRVDAHRSRDKGGTGLGLAIVKHIVQRHRGRLSVQSTLGKGSTFSVFLPAALP
jgi:two-component system, OmpR family, phosphate regulon sensor histidine kinase PhoR